jgi:peptidoglycan lytic transglycosylase B
MKSITGLLLLVPLCWGMLISPAQAERVQDNPVLRTLMDEMVTNHGFTHQELEDWFSQVEIRDDIIEAINRPKENLPWYEYRKLFVNDDSARRGAAFWKANADALSRASSEYGVPPEIIVAILGIETFYGRQGGHYRVIDALVTLTLRYPERSDFYRGQLVDFLLLARELGVSPLTIKGSYAGAMGIPQFIPSSYRSFAVDFDDDHKRDLTDTNDAIGSVANFLKQHGWRRDEPILGEVKLNGSMYAWLENNGLEPRISIQHLSRYGILPVERIDAHQLAALIMFEGETAPIHRLGYNNFYMITRYNRSKNYSLAVVELSEMIRKLYYGE